MDRSTAGGSLRTLRTRSAMKVRDMRSSVTSGARSSGRSYTSFSSGWRLVGLTCVFMHARQGSGFLAPNLHMNAMGMRARSTISKPSVGPESLCYRRASANAALVMRIPDNVGQVGPRSDQTRLSVEPRDAHVRGTGVRVSTERAAIAGMPFVDGRQENEVAEHRASDRCVADHASNSINRLEQHFTDIGNIDGGGGIGGGGDGGGHDGQGGGDDDGGEHEGSDELEFEASGQRRERIVRKVDKAVQKGKIPQECSSAYAQLLTSPVMSLLCKNGGWRARLLGDATFMTKLAIEMVTGTFFQVLAEYQKRGKKFGQELDFVFADTLTCLFANFAAVWLSCPTVAVKASQKGIERAGGALQQFLASCPSNAFQKVVTEGGISKSFSLSQRGAALVTPMPKLFIIGFGATMFGYGLIAALEMVHSTKSSGRGATKSTSPDAHEKPPVPVLGSCLAIGTFLAVSTNLRYQFIAGAVEQRLFASMTPGLSSLGSTAVRSANLYIGSLTIVDWLRFVGLQH